MRGPGGNFPLAPLARLTRLSLEGAESTRRRLAADIGVTDRTIDRWATAGIPPWRADPAAMALGFHPCEVWGERWWNQPGAESAMAELDERALVGAGGAR